MAAHIKTLTIENFKSLKKLTLEKCANVNIILGKPNVGKSSILEALSLLGNHSGEHFFSDFVHYESIVDLFTDQEIHSRVIQIETDIAQVYLKYLTSSDSFWYLLKQNLNMNKHQFLQIQDVSDVINSKLSLTTLGGNIPTFVSQSILNKAGNSHYPNLYKKSVIPVRRYEYRRLLKHDAHFSGYLTPPFGENLVAILQSNSELRSLVTPLFGEYNVELVMDVSERILKIQKRQNGLVYSLPYSMVADTLQRMILYIAAINSNKGSVLLFEEPEAHAFPPYVKMLADYIALDCENQYFITTHSPYLLQTLAREIDADVAVFVVDIVNHETVARRIEGASFQRLLDAGSSVFFDLERL